VRFSFWWTLISIFEHIPILKQLTDFSHVAFSEHIMVLRQLPDFSSCRVFGTYHGFETITGFQLITHSWPFSKSNLILKSERVNLVAPACPIERLLYLPNVRAIQYKLGPEGLTQLGNSNVLRLPVSCRVFETYQLVLRQLPEFISM